MRYYQNKETNEVFNSIEDMVLDAQNEYKRCMDVTYCDIECVLTDNEGTSYILDECGNWNYFPEDLYEIIEKSDNKPSDLCDKCELEWTECTLDPRTCQV